MKRNRSRRLASRPRVLSARRFFRPLLEQFEDRRMLAVSDDLVSQLTQYQAALSNTLDVAVNLPLVGDQLAELQEWNTVFEDSVESLRSRVDSLANGHHELAIPLPSLPPQTFTFDLGLDAFLQVKTSGGVRATINPVLNVAFDLTNGVPSLDPTNTGLDIGFVISLPNFELTASLHGYLFAKAVDEGTTFSGNLGFRFTSGLGIEAEFSGDAHVRLGLSVSLVDPALNASFNPSFTSDLELDWGFDTSGDQLKVPVIAFRDFSLDADSFMQGFLGDTVKGVQKFTLPMQPFIDMFEQPVPIVSSFDSDETMGDLFLKGAGLSQEQQESFNTMVKIVKAVNKFDFSGTTGGAVINFGDILITGDARQAGQFIFNTSQLQGVIDDIMNSPALQEVQEKLETVAEYVGFTADAGFKYPLLENPGPVIGSLLTGQPEVMFSYSTGRQHFELGVSAGVGIPDLFGFFVNAGIVFDASLSVGYDTAGLIKFTQNGEPENLLHGFYMDNSIDTSGPPIPNIPNPRKTSLYLQGHADISASAVVTLSGGLYADIAFELASNSTSTRVYLDDIITNLQSNVKVFNPSGRLYAAANIELTVPTGGVGPNITLFEHRLGYLEVLSFNLPPAPTPSLPLTVIDVTNQHTLLLDVTKMTGNGVVKVQPFHDYPIAEDGGYLGDGIRVDYPGEIVMYVERKDDITTNYYNFIGLNGTVPDRVSIDIVDPFNVFDTEGAPDPQPAQTEPGVLLAGGKDVVYRYTDKPGGGLARVLLAGGYGSNNLNGGTMSFGNFVPADRMNQAKSHFGNVTGFDAPGQAYINSRLDAVAAPASPTGVIGATMTGSRGGLMYGGPGNNSFIATGPGAYEMVGGAWTNNFTISPSFNGVPATYEIDGGPFGKSVLVVRVPTGENVSMENSTIVDKYNATLKALAVKANAGLSATAHGLRKVSIVAAAGADVELGDTSELNIEFTIVGASDFSFGGSNSPDTISVSADYSFYGREDLRYVRQLAAHWTYTAGPNPSAIIPGLQNNTLTELSPGNYAFNYSTVAELFPPYPVDRLDGPVYSITRTFGNTGLTQEAKFRVNNPFASSIKLNGKGGADTYNITQGLGSFLDIEVRDSDPATRNIVNVDFRHPLLLPQTAILTNNVLRLNYFTPMTHFATRWWDGQQYQSAPTFRNFFSTSAAYTPAVFFGANVDITLRMGRPFQETIVDRTNPPIGQRATILFDGVLDAYEAPGVLGWDAEYMGSPSQPGHLWYHLLEPDWWRTYFVPTIITQAYDTQNPEAGIIPINAQFYQSGTATNWNYYLALAGSNVTVVTVRANAGDLTIDQSTIGLGAQLFDVRGNTGTILFKKTDGGINTYNVYANEGTVNYEITRAWGFYPTQYDVFTVVGNSGTVNFNHTITGTYRGDGYIVGLDHVINVLGNAGVINANTTVPRSLINYGIETQVNVGGGSLATVHGTINLANSNGHYGLYIDDRTNPGAGSAWTIDRAKTVIGDLTINYPNVNLPVPYADTFSTYEAFPKSSSTVTVIQDPQFYQKLYNGSAFPAITLSAPFSLFKTTGEVVNQAITATGPGGPMTFAASNLPPGLSINPTTGMISGTIAPGSSAASPYESIVSVGPGQFRRAARMNWYITSGITILLDQNELADFEGESVSAVISATNIYNLPVTFSVTGLPPGILFNPNARTISGTISPGAGQNGPYLVNVHATDGTETADLVFNWNVTGITLNPPGNQVSVVGESVNFALQGSTVSGAPLVYAAEGLPDGLSINANTGVISGVIAAAAAETRWFYPSITATNGNDSAQEYFAWSVLPAGVSNYVSLGEIGLKNSREGENGYFQPSASSSLYLPLTYTVTGLPPGLEFIAYDGEGGNYVNGTIAPGAAASSPYQVQIVATDGRWSDTVTFDWIVRPAGTVLIQNYDEPWYAYVNQTFSNFQIYAEHAPGETLAFSATGLPSGLSINAQTGVISGTVLPVAASPSVFQTSVTATSASDSDTWSFLWTVFSTYASNEVTLPNPSGSGTFDISSPPGTTLSASISPSAGVALPAGVAFPYGFLTFTIEGLQPGQAAELTLSGLEDVSLITAYYRHGATPANTSSHWYNFLHNLQTDSDSAVGTGMVEVGEFDDEIVLHFIDGGRGDDDLARNGIIFDIGGPAITSTVINQPPVITSNGGGDLAAIVMAENTTAVTTVAANDPDAATTLAFSISGGADAARFSINPGTGALQFMAAPNFESPADADGNNTYLVIVQASDGSLTDSQTLTVTVTNANEPPVITSNGGSDAASVSIPEDTTAVTTVATIDPDAGTTIVYSINGGADAAMFAINPSNGALAFATAPNFEAPTDADENNSYAVIVQASDGTLTDWQTWTVTVTDANELPTITSNDGGDSASISVQENTTAVTTVAATDPDAGTTLTYRIVGGADAFKFAIDTTTGSLSLLIEPNFESPTDANVDNVYEVVVAANDGTLGDLQTLTVTVTNANETPVVTSNGGGNSATVSAPENTTAVTTVTAIDHDAGTTLTYSISGGVDAARFAINATTGALQFVTAPNFESPADVGGNNVYDVVVQATDGSLADIQAISVQVTDVAEGNYSISGKVYRDVTGNGKSTDDVTWNVSTPVTLNLYRDVNGDGAYQSSDTFLGSTIAGAGGVFTFAAATTGKYLIKEVVPSDFVRTFPVLSEYQAVNLSGTVSSGNNWYNAPKYDIGIVTNVSYIVNHGGVLTTVSDLRGNTHEGDKVTANFTVTASAQLTLLSYLAPGPTFSPNTASQQTIHKSVGGTFGPGSHSLTVEIPKSYYQIDFVAGPAINQLGPAGSNIFYTEQTRLISADNGGVNSPNMPAIDLALSTTVNNPAPLLGSNVLLTVKVSNAAGWSAATGVRVKDALPAGLTYVSSTATQGTYNSSTGEWNLLSPLSSGGMATLTITATVATAGEKKNAAQVTAAGAPDIDSSPNNDSSPSMPHNEDDDDCVSISPQLWTKFFVVNDASTGSTPENTFEYAPDGTVMENYQLSSGNSAPRGAATTAAGNKVWVIDANQMVYVYDAGGTLLGSWSAGGLASNSTPEGIATNGTDIWIVDAQQDKVFKYANAASRISGSQNAASSFALNSGNKNPKDIVASSSHLWVVDDSSTDKVFKYTLSGGYLGGWTITGGGGSPTGITLDPANVNHLWIVDKSTDRVYQLNAAASRTSGSQSPASSFALGNGNSSPEGIADPPPVAKLVTEETPARSSVRTSSARPFDVALLAVIDEINGLSNNSRKMRR